MKTKDDTKSDISMSEREELAYWRGKAEALESLAGRAPTPARPDWQAAATSTGPTGEAAKASRALQREAYGLVLKPRRWSLCVKFCESSNPKIRFRAVHSAQPRGLIGLLPLESIHDDLKAEIRRNVYNVIPERERPAVLCLLDGRQFDDKLYAISRVQAEGILGEFVKKEQHALAQVRVEAYGVFGKTYPQVKEQYALIDLAHDATEVPAQYIEWSRSDAASPNPEQPPFAQEPVRAVELPPEMPSMIHTPQPSDMTPEEREKMQDRRPTGVGF